MFYIVGTPIGNLEEITFRAVRVLKEVDMILCEDTRHSKILLEHYDIVKPLYSYEKFNERERTSFVIESLKAGKNIALISDAGMPIISDPGSVVLSAIIENGLEYTVVSGACAAINALALSGMDASSFTFAGFLPPKQKERDALLDRFLGAETTLVFYLPPQDVISDLNFLFSRLGNRKFALVREISKKFEEVAFGTLGNIPPLNIKGEFALVVEGKKQENMLLNLSVEEHLLHFVAAGFTNIGAIKQVAKERGVAKSQIYAIAQKVLPQVAKQ